MKNINANIIEQIKRQTKIIATIGPNINNNKKLLQDILMSGVNIVRLNMSHGNHKEHDEKIKNIKNICKENNLNISILLDLSGPKIRTGEVKNDLIELIPNKKIKITTENIIGDDHTLTIKYKNLLKEVDIGNEILLDDGKIKLLVEKKEEETLLCKILIGGHIKGRRGVNIPKSHLSISSLTKKDEDDVNFAIKNKIKYLALSFVRNKEDIIKLKELLPKNYKPIIISKIETEESLNNIEEILNESDGIMIARGDLAIETPREKVPLIQKDLTEKARLKGKIVIIATQMLESMIDSPTPTRAEVSDIATAIFDGTDAIMLSGESANGHYPREAVETMVNVAKTVDPFINKNYNSFQELSNNDYLRINSVSIAEKIKAKAIVSITKTGYTPKILSKFRTKIPIIAMTDNTNVLEETLLFRGIWPLLINNNAKNLNELRTQIKNILFENKILKRKDNIVIVICGIKFEKETEVNSILVETI